MPAVAAMEDAGVKVDRDALAELSRDFAPPHRRDRGSRSGAMSGNEFNIGSTKQLGDVLFEKLQLPGGKKGKTGAYGTDASILETLGAAASGAGAGARMAAADQAQIDLCRRARRRDRQPRPAACTPPSRWPRPRPGGCPRPSPTSRTSRSAPRKGAKSAAPLSPSRAICCCRPITARSNCGSPAHVADVAELKRRLPRGASTSTR